MRIFLIGILVSLILSCNEKKEDITMASSHYGYQMGLKEKVICKGDKEAYQELLDTYSDDWNKEDMLSYALVMANKYDYSQAYYDVFDILISLPKINANVCASDTCSEVGYYCLDDKTKKMAIGYFSQAIYKGNKFASKKLLDFYNKGKHYPIEELYIDTLLIEKAKQNVQNSE